MTNSKKAKIIEIALNEVIITLDFKRGYDVTKTSNIDLACKNVAKIYQLKPKTLIRLLQI